MSQTDYYRERAAECHQQADAVTSESVRKTLRNVAKKYLALAANEERSAMFDALMADDRLDARN
jgi:hypothetical protein